MQITELEEVAFLSNVKCGGENITRLGSKPDANGFVAWSASLDGGIVTVKRARCGSIIHVPLTNVAFLAPRAVEKKAAAKK